MKNKYIAHYVHNLEKYSGAAFQGEQLAKHLKDKKGIKTFIINKTNINKTEIIKRGNILAINIPKNKILRLIALIKICRNIKFEILHMHGYEDIAFLIMNIYRKKILLKSTIVGEDFDSLCKKRPLFLKRLLKNVAFNNALCKEIYDVNKKYTSKIGIIPNFIQQNEAVGLENKKNIFVVVGAVCSRKRTYESIQYFIENYANLKDAKLYIIGPYSEEYYSEYDKDYIKKCKLISKGKNIIFQGMLEQDEVINLLRKAKGIIFFSSREGFPNALLEAISMNVAPIICQTNEVAHSILNKGKYGFFLDSYKGLISIEEINELIKSKNLYECSKKYHIDLISNQYISIYSKL